MTVTDLYQQAILDHARAAVGAGRLEDATGTATADNPLCGDRVTVDVRLDDGRIAALGHHVRGCVLCTASASILSRHGVGREAREVREAASALAAMLENDGAVPGGWPDLSIFEPVKRAKSRHQCVLLPFEAARRALEDAEAA
ncbi:MAG: iron-sulfur cluster assembly scaffold protein [Inquilinaceae bacterium]